MPAFGGRPFEGLALLYGRVGPAVEGVDRRGVRRHDPFGMFLIGLVEDAVEYPGSSRVFVLLETALSGLEPSIRFNLKTAVNGGITTTRPSG